MTDFAEKTNLTELEKQILDTSTLATKTALTVVENKIPSVSNLVKETDYNTKVTEIENKPKLDASGSLLQSLIL